MRWLAPLGGLGLLVAVATSPQEARAQAPVVVEFFTSQGCSSCPPADEIFSGLARQADVIALALHVDYWDYLGWKDPFGKAENSERQRGYAKAHKERTIYTPQMVVQGRELLVGHDEAMIRARIAAHEAVPSKVRISLRRTDGGLEIELEPEDGPVGATEIHVVEFMPERTMTVEGGENAGYRHAFANVVSEWETIGGWDGSTATTLIHDGEVGANVAVLVQAPRQGPILSAARLP